MRSKNKWFDTQGCNETCTTRWFQRVKRGHVPTFCKDGQLPSDFWKVWGEMLKLFWRWGKSWKDVQRLAEMAQLFIKMPHLQDQIHIFSHRWDNSTTIFPSPPLNSHPPLEPTPEPWATFLHNTLYKRVQLISYQVLESLESHYKDDD